MVRKSSTLLRHKRNTGVVDAAARQTDFNFESWEICGKDQCQAEGNWILSFAEREKRKWLLSSERTFSREKNKKLDDDKCFQFFLLFIQELNYFE